MKKVLIGILAVVILAGAGYLAVDQWSQARARGEVEQIFTALRLSGAAASHGPLRFDLSERTLTLEGVDIAAPDDGAKITAAQLVLRGVSTPRQGRFTARLIEIAGLSVRLRDAGTGIVADYAAPTLRIEEYEGPTALLALPAGTGRHDGLRFALQHFASLAAARISAPDVEVNLTFTLGDRGERTVSGAYGQTEAQGVGGGKIARLAFGAATFSTSGETLAPQDRLSGTLEGLEVTEIDTGPLLALTLGDTRPAGYATLYGGLTGTGYAVARADGSRQTIATFTAAQVALDPSALSLDRLEEVMNLARSTPDLAREKEAQVLDLVTDLIAGVGFERFEMSGVTAEDASGGIEVANMRLVNFSGGTLERFSIEGLTGRTDDGRPLKMDKVVLTGFSLAPLFTLSAEALRNDAEPAAGSLLVLFQMADGIELAGIEAPRDDSDLPVRIETLHFNWGDYIGDMPTRLVFSATGVSGPIFRDDGPPLSYLAAAGRRTASLDASLTLIYDQAARTLTLTPAELKVDQAFALSVRATLTDVPRKAFEDPLGLLAASGEIALGEVTLSATNLGIADLILNEEAEAARVEPEDLRTEIVSAIERDTREFAAHSPDAATVGAALAAFIKDPHILTITLTPKRKVPLLDLMGAAPDAALAAFSVTATTSK